MRAQCLAPWRRVRPRGSVPAHRWRGERVLRQRCGVRGAEAACRALGPVEIRRHEVLDEAVAMIACMRACSGQGRVLVGGSPNLPLQDACLRVCGGRAVATTARFAETLPQFPARKKTRLSHARSRLCGGNGVRARAQTTRQRVAIGATMQSTAWAWPHSMHGCAFARACRCGAT